MKKHNKHANITRPNYGEFHRNEYAIIGTPCGAIQQLAQALIEQLAASAKVSYVDADHVHADEETIIFENAHLNKGANLVYTDKITHHRLDFKGELNKFQFRTLFNQQDAVIVNGNHFLAKKQLVVIDSRKEKSLRKKLDRLTNIQAFLLHENSPEIPEYLKESFPKWSKIPVYSFTDIDAITQLIQQDLQKNIAPLYGLVLAGGKSQRMGEDKGLINYHGKEQREYIADLLAPLCKEVFISCRQDQVIASSYPSLSDTFTGFGPFGAILSAFKEKPDAAWLVVACDLPLLDKPTLTHLVDSRDTSKNATAFHNTATGFPDPLITIWEPRSYPVLLQFMAQGYACPRKVLINTTIEEINLKREEAIMNVNNQEEKKIVMKKLAY